MCGTFVQQTTTQWKKINNDILKFVGKWVDLGKNIMNEVTQTQKDKYNMYSLISGF